MVRIYVKNKPLILTDSIDKDTEEYLHRQETIFIDELNPAAIRTMLLELEKDEVYTGVFLHPDVTALLEAFKSHLTLVKAAGGLVFTPQREVLVIFRKGKWDLPKGKLDDGETLEACALREIEEETGATDLKIARPMKVSYHTYHEGTKHILKESHWFLVETPVASALKPQVEEDIEKCEWVSLEQATAYTSNMHASIIDVFREAESILQQKA